MENATKALLMAAGLLIGIVILSLAVYEFATFGSSSAEIHKANEEAQLNEFNSQFTVYEGKDDVTIYDVITLANLATENNKYYEFATRTGTPSAINNNDYYIYVKLEKNYDLLSGAGISGDSISFGSNKSGEEITKSYNKIIDNALKKQNYEKYNCIVEINPTTKRVWKVTFKPQGT